MVTPFRLIATPEGAGRDHVNRRPEWRGVSIAREYCGFAKPKWVARFCDDWIGHADSRQKARELCLDHAIKLFPWRNGK